MGNLESPINPTLVTAYLWTVEEAGVPGETHEEHANSTQKVDSGPSPCEVLTVLATMPPCGVRTSSAFLNYIVKHVSTGL